MNNTPITADEYKKCKTVITAYRNILEPEDDFRRMAKGDERTVVADFGEIGFLITYVSNDVVSYAENTLIKTSEDLFENLWEVFQNNFYSYHTEYDPIVYVPYNAAVVTLPEELEEKLELLRKKFEKAAFPHDKETSPEDLERLVINLFQYKKLTDETKKTIASWVERKVNEKDVTAAYAIMIKNCRTPNFTYLKKCVDDISGRDRKAG